jgi:hypothetical protein
MCIVCLLFYFLSRRHEELGCSKNQVAQLCANLTCSMSTHFSTLSDLHCAGRVVKFFRVAVCGQVLHVADHSIAESFCGRDSPNKTVLS